MKKAKGLWRTLSFFILLAALCGSFALPVGSVSVNAAPRMQAATNIVISEFRTRGLNGAADEFVELYNPTANPILIAGWQLKVLTATGTEATRTTIPSGINLASGQHYLIANSSASGYSGSVTPNLTYTTGIVDAGGVAIFDNNNVKIDSVGLNTTFTIYIEGNPLSALSSDTNQSYERNLDVSGSCIDSNNNASDFFLRNPSDPQNFSSPLTTCGNPTQTPTPTDTATATGTATNTGTPTNTATATNTSTASAASVVISEFRTTGPGGASDEFVELYNPTSNWVDISGWKINASNKDGDIQTRATIPAATILRSGQYYLVANNSYSNTTVTADLKYGTSITDDGGIGLIKSDGTTIDEVGMSAGSFYQEGTPLSSLSNNKSYERKDGGTSDSCIDTSNNASDFSAISLSNLTLHNYSSPLSLCGTARTTPSTTSTTITADSPDPSVINGNVSVSVKVTGVSTIPSGIVSITGASTICSINLNASGTGSCSVKFTSTGSKTLTATYLGDNTHKSSGDTESHQVTSSSTTFKTPTPAPLPPPQLVAINEFVPRPGHDWNHDGTVNVGDEYIEILNHGTVDVNLSGYSLDDEVNIGSDPYRLPSKVLKPGERVVFYGSETGLLLGDGGDGVRLLKPNGQLIDAYNYTIARYPDESYCRLPDNGGADDWNQNCYPTPGLQNSLSGNFAPPSNGISEESSCPISDTLPDPFVQAECDPFGNNIWRSEFWDRTGWYDGKDLPKIDGKWPVFAD